MTIISTVLDKGKLSPFGIAMPQFAPAWTDGVLPTVEDNDMALRTTANWLAPLAGIVRPADKPGVTLVLPNGSLVDSRGIILTLYTHMALRLQRLYALELEAAGRPEREQGLPLRPVPRHFWFESGSGGGQIAQGEPMGTSGRMMIFDDQGMPLDVLAVAAAFTFLMEKHNLLQHHDLSDSFKSGSQLKQIAELAGSTPVVRVRLCSHAGQPYDGANLHGLTKVPDSSGIFTLNASSGTGSDLTGTITRADASDSFPANQRRKLLLGPATTGQLNGTFDPPDRPSGVSLTRDFFSVRVFDVGPFLLGTPNTAFRGAELEARPEVRTTEPLTVLADGNDVLGAAAQALAGAPTEALVVAQTIDGGFVLPSAPGDPAHWPQFPSTTGSPAAGGALPVGLRDSFAPTAMFFDDGSGAPRIDVVLTLNELPEEAWVRVYPRKYLPDAQGRGDGAGGRVPSSHTLALLLKDPFGLGGTGLSGDKMDTTLRVDVMVLKRTGEARLYGNVDVKVQGTTTASPTLASAPNLFVSATRRGISSDGILGLTAPALPSLKGLPALEAELKAAVALGADTVPREASRLPTMARRDVLVAGLASGSWSAVISGGRLVGGDFSADARHGGPGNPDGFETQLTGVQAGNGRLAYDIARMALRRTTSLGNRLTALVENAWALPAEPSGTFAGAVLQTVAPTVETPELALLRYFLDGLGASDIPQDFDGLLTWLSDRLSGIERDLSTWTGRLGVSQSSLTQFMNTLQTTVIDKIGTLRSDQKVGLPAERLYQELRREVMAAAYGRRDAQWALQGAIKNARNFIYIESPGFAATQNTAQPYAVDLVQLLQDRMTQVPNLHVMVATPRRADYGRGYEVVLSYEIQARKTELARLAQDRLVAFHPLNFPGRPARLDSTLVIVDDVWALIGSSSFRRRGLTFDGGSDLVFTDTVLHNGICRSIRDLRRRVMAARLGIPQTESSSFGAMPHPDYVRLSDGAEAFYVIRDLLATQGRIEGLYNGEEPGAGLPDPAKALVGIDQANPEGLEFDILGIVLLSVLAGLNGENCW